MNIKSDPHTQIFKAFFPWSSCDCLSDILTLPVGELCAVVHHTASLQSVCKPAYLNKLFHAFVIVWMLVIDIAMIQLLSAKRRRPRKLPPTGNPYFMSWHNFSNLLAALSRAAPNKSAAHGSPCGTDLVRRMPGVTLSSNFTTVSKFLNSRIHFHSCSDNLMVRYVIESGCHSLSKSQTLEFETQLSVR